MLFHSLAFAIFLPLTFAAYWALDGRSVGRQNALLLAASYLFYGWWDWRFLSLIILSSAVDYGIGRRLAATADNHRRRLLLIASLVVNLGILGYFKYCNFFLESLDRALNAAGLPATGASLAIVLPVGISFYTFQTLSYTIDIYRGRLRPTRDPVAFFAFVAFFPQLVAGPIERASALLPQFEKQRRLVPAQAHDGLRQILWGLVKKVVVADTLAVHVNAAFTDPRGHDGSTLALAAVFFALQIYCDFSGYSDIAIGTARLFGFGLMRNFAFPYFARDIGDFWRRWHISLSTWFRDYVFIPLGGSRGTASQRWRNVTVTFVISGFWHGANWTFLFWGLLHALYYLVGDLVGGRDRAPTRVPADSGRLLPTPRAVVEMATTFTLVLIAWVFFRAESIGDAFEYLQAIWQQPWSWPSARRPIGLTVSILGIEWLQRARSHGLAIEHLPRTVRWPIYYALIALLFFFGPSNDAPFIYFQF